MQETNTVRPEPGIATDRELSVAVSEASGAIPDHYLDKRPGEQAVYAERLSPDSYGVDEWSEIIKVQLKGNDGYVKTQVINALMDSDASVHLRDLEQGHSQITLYPTNQAE